MEAWCEPSLHSLSALTRQEVMVGPARWRAHQILPLLQDVEYLNAGPFLS